MKHRVKAARRWRGSGIEATQRKELERLTRAGSRTRYGAKDGVEREGGRLPITDDYVVFSHALPLSPYPTIREAAMRMVRGERDVLWPGQCRRFAQSSGTSDGKSKYIPVTNDSLKFNHYVGAGDAVAHYLCQYPDSRMFGGKGFILGGSFANELTLPPGVCVGDLSANLIDAVNPLVNLFRVPSKKVALMESWDAKLPALVEGSRRVNVTNISGVPSWFMTVLRRVIEAEGARTIHDVWPNLEVFFHGGIAMDPYRHAYAELTDPGRPMRYRETYNASEGFFAVQDTIEPEGMLLLLDAGVFYEFIPLESYDEGEVWPEAVPAWQVEKGKIYALVITAMNGLWRYPIGDTVRIESTDPLRITIAGRTKHFINAFGEEVMVYNTDRAVMKACEKTGARVDNYTVAPVFAEGKRHGRHQWLIEWGVAPNDSEYFADILDAALQSENSDYQAKRAGSIFLDRLEIVTAKKGLFDRWLATTGKLGGQRKVPRLANNRDNMDSLLSMNG
ncbi:MAG: GH3 auxin-responsive promoter family protein [Muribaculaceae bacterium]|nr:GH3 auxin-responsive promoter family protein [Muribaculaceae bacterium]